MPLIQRDYAQGRSDQEEVREGFLAALHDALLLPPEHEKLPINLDFVYGSVEGENPTRFQPLDGQQRLTTLFLLHWYLAWRDDCSEMFRKIFVVGNHSRFSYEVRTSSTEFFDELVRFFPDQAPENVEHLGALLQDQPWYYRSWRLDPTVQSALVMLDAIHARFKDTHNPRLYARLTDSEQPAITFQLLDLNNFDLSDDLYIKMNARGKPLTPFETFKARYEEILKVQSSNETYELDGQSVSLAKYFARRMDTRWADFFWRFRDPDSHVFDAAVMNVFRVVILITRPTKSSTFSEDVTKLRSQDRKNSYHFFHEPGWLDVSFAETLVTLLDKWSGQPGGFAPLLPDGRYFDEGAVLEKVLKKPSSLGYDELVQLAAYVQFLRTQEGAPDPKVFQEWARVVSNLSVNTDYNRASDFERSLSSLADLAPHMVTVLDHLADPKTEIKGFFQEQVREERIKARLLLENDSWRPLIDEAEAHGYFQGQIGFLLKFAGIETDSANTLQYQAAFSDYLSKAKAMFGDGGLNSLPDYKWERALLSLGNYLLLASSQNSSLLVNRQSDQASWKRLLRDAPLGKPQGKVLLKLWDSLSGTSDISKQLDGVIAGVSGLDAWRAALVESPAAIDYCGKRMIRHVEKDRVYLLSKVRTSGAHVELFSYCFYLNAIVPSLNQGLYKALRPDYFQSNSAAKEPSIQLHFDISDQPCVIDIVYESGRYQVCINFKDDPPDALSWLLKDLKPDGTQNSFCTYYPADALEKLIRDLDQRLACMSGEICED